MAGKAVLTIVPSIPAIILDNNKAKVIRRRWVIFIISSQTALMICALRLQPGPQLRLIVADSRFEAPSVQVGSGVIHRHHPDWFISRGILVVLPG